MLRFLPVALLFASVAFAQGVPRPPAFNPVTDSPITTGQPGTLRKPPERSPHTRYLPPAKEPGLWAGDAKAIKKVGWAMVVLETTIPLPSFDADASLEPLIAMECTERIDGAVLDSKRLDTDARRLILKERECAAAMAFSTCLSTLRQRLSLEEAARKSADAAIRDALAFIQKICPGEGRSQRAIDFAGRVAEAASKKPGGTAH